MSDPSSASMGELGRLVREGRLKFRDILEACLDRERATRGLNAFTEVFHADARALADGFQTLLDHGYDLGPLHGMPIALKANIAVAGRRMTAGSRILADNRVEADAMVTRRLKRAGAVLVGYTNMHEFAWGGTTANPHHGQCRNPWDPDRIPAGSSGGSGVAVAVGSAVATLGTDTGGSVRLPASMNGVTGLRPGVGRISCDGVFPLAWTMDTVGPIARSAADCATMFAVLADETPAAVETRLARPLSGVTIGILDGYGDAGLQPDVAEAFRACRRGLEDLGVTVRSLSLDGLDVAVDAQVVVDACEPSAIHDDWISSRAADYGEDVRVLLQAGLAFTATEYIHAQRYRTFLRQQLDAAFGDVDAILTPTLPFTAPRIGQNRIVIGGEDTSTLTGNMRFTCIPSLAALPAVSFPIGFDRSRMPIGAQVMTADRGEHEALRVAHQFQRVTDFHASLPGLASH